MVEPEDRDPPFAVARPRLVEVDCAKGMAIILVVVGHFADGSPPGNPWYGFVKDTIYLFHMSFFLFISGFLLSHSLEAINSTRDYFQFVRRRSYPIVPAYLLYGLAAVSGKMILSAWLPLRAAPDEFLSGMGAILLTPMASASRQLWYLYALFNYVVILPLLLMAVGQKHLVWLVPFGLIAWFVPATSLFALDQTCEYLLVVVLGLLAARDYEWFVNRACHYAWMWVCFFAICLALPWLGVDFGTAKLAAGIISIPTLWALACTKVATYHNVLPTIGRYTFVIYLMHSPIMAAGRLLLVRLDLFAGSLVILIFAMLVPLAVWLPIFAKRRLFVHFRPIDSLTG
jgi:peptidoglycan/LPS O-acetylase OafA/YrhL